MAYLRNNTYFEIRQRGFEFYGTFVLPNGKSSCATYSDAKKMIIKLKQQDHNKDVDFVVIKVKHCEYVVSDKVK